MIEIDKLTESINQMRETLARHTENLEQLLGNGQPGELQRIKNDISDLKRDRDRLAGAFGVIAIIWASLKAYFFFGGHS